MSKVQITSGNYANVAEVIIAGMKGIQSTVSPLSRLWRVLLYNMNMKPVIWAALSNRHFAYLADNPSQKTSDRTNLEDALGSSDMSVISFTRGIAVLNPTSCELEVTIAYEDGKVTYSVSEDLMDESDKSPLSKIWSGLIYTMKLPPAKWSELADEHYANGEFGSSDRSNDLRALQRDTLTMKAFLKGIDILDPETCNLAITLTMGDPKKSQFKSNVKLTR